MSGRYDIFRRVNFFRMNCLEIFLVNFYSIEMCNNGREKHTQSAHMLYSKGTWCSSFHGRCIIQVQHCGTQTWAISINCPLFHIVPTRPLYLLLSLVLLFSCVLRYLSPALFCSFSLSPCLLASFALPHWFYLPVARKQSRSTCIIYNSKFNRSKLILHK